jgi:hypothetical protein
MMELYLNIPKRVQDVEVKYLSKGKTFFERGGGEKGRSVTQTSITESQMMMNDDKCGAISGMLDSEIGEL